MVGSLLGRAQMVLLQKLDSWQQQLQAVSLELHLLPLNFSL